MYLTNIDLSINSGQYFLWEKKKNHGMEFMEKPY